MTAPRSFAAELLHRRVPQLVGMYVAATWMMVEIGEWAAERFGLPGNFTLVLFVVLAVMLPSVVLVSYNHGAPGRDHWTRLEKGWLPVNLLLAVLAVQFLLPASAPLPGPEAAPPRPEPPRLLTQRELVDETGAKTVLEVPAIDYFERIAAFPWEPEGGSGNGEHGWLAHGIPILLEQDIDRSHFLSVDTVMDLASAPELAADGYPDGRAMPQALRLRLAREQGDGFLVEGTYTVTGERYRLKANVLDVDRNHEVARFEAESGSLLTAVDEISGQLAVAATPDLPESDDLRTDLAIAAHFTDALPVARLYVEARLRRFFDNDYAGALEKLARATDADPTFAAGFAFTAFLNKESGKPQEAQAALDRALALDYKLDSERRLLLKAERYGILGESDKAVRVLEMLTEVHPFSAYAFRVLGSNYLLLSRIDAAERAFRRVRELDPSDAQVILTLADLSRIRQELPRARALVEEYLAEKPDDASAVRKLAALQVADGEFDAARATYERAAILANDDFAAELALAKLDIWQAEFEGAARRLDRITGADATPAERVQGGLARVLMYQLQGRIEAGLAEIDAIGPAAQRALTPVQQVFSLGAQRAGLQAMLGRQAQALAEIETMRRQVQPPMDGFLNFARISVFLESENAEEFRPVLEEATAFAEQYQFPFLEPFIQAGFGKLATLEGRPEDALQLTREAMRTFRESLLALQEPYIADMLQVQLTEALRELGRLEEARNVIENHLVRYPADGEARLEHVRVLRAAGDEAAARAALERLRELWSDADTDFKGLARLAELDGLLAAGPP